MPETPPPYDRPYYQFPMWLAHRREFGADTKLLYAFLYSIACANHADLNEDIPIPDLERMSEITRFSKERVEYYIGRLQVFRLVDVTTEQRTKGKPVIIAYRLLYHEWMDLLVEPLESPIEPPFKLESAAPKPRLKLVP